MADIVILIAFSKKTRMPYHPCADIGSSWLHYDDAQSISHPQILEKRHCCEEAITNDVFGKVEATTSQTCLSFPQLPSIRNDQDSPVLQIIVHQATWQITCELLRTPCEAWEPQAPWAPLNRLK